MKALPELTFNILISICWILVLVSAITMINIKPEEGMIRICQDYPKDSPEAQIAKALTENRLITITPTMENETWKK